MVGAPKQRVSTRSRRPPTRYKPLLPRPLQRDRQRLVRCARLSGLGRRPKPTTMSGVALTSWRVKAAASTAREYAKRQRSSAVQQWLAGVDERTPAELLANTVVRRTTLLDANGVQLSCNGLFAECQLHDGDILGEYIGAVFSAAAWDTHLHAGYGMRCVARTGAVTYIDGYIGGNRLALINSGVVLRGATLHRSKYERPQLMVSGTACPNVKITVHKSKLMMTVIQDVARGEELLTTYDGFLD